MVQNDEGMTKTYNRFHDPYEDDPEIAELRELHGAMDRAVLDAYGWSDIPTDCDFLLDYEIDEATWGRKKKPYRYRWPDPVQRRGARPPPRPQCRARFRGSPLRRGIHLISPGFDSTVRAPGQSARTAIPPNPHGCGAEAPLALLR